MKITPFQSLFIQQASAYGSSRNNILHGRAVFKQIEYKKLSSCLELLIQQSEWTKLKLDKSNSNWTLDENFGGTLSIGNRIDPSSVSLTNLWVISLYEKNENYLLEVAIHHALADAHSFQIFWTDLIRLYYGMNTENNLLHVIKDDFTPTQLPNIKNIESIGIGPIQRHTVTISSNRKSDIEKKASSKNSYLSTVFLIVLQHLLDQTENLIGINLQTGFALRNRSGKQARSNFLTSVNFLPITHGLIDKIKDLDVSLKQLFRHQSYPLTEWLKDNNRSVAFNVLFSFQKEEYFKHDEQAIAELAFLPVDADENILSVHVLEHGDHTLKISFDFRTDIADKSFWRSFIFNYLKGVNDFLNGSNIKIKFKDAVLKNNQVNSKSLWIGFESAPDEKTALISNNKKLTFGEIKSALKTETNKSNKLVFVNPDRSIQSIISILSAWKNNQVVTFFSDISETIPDGDFLYLAQTTGSTGIPKKILISKSGIETLLPDWNKILNINSESIHLSTADQRFDVFFGDLFRSIMSGNTMVLANENEKLIPKELIKLINTFNVTHYESTPSLLQLLIPQINDKTTLKILIAGSEPLTSSLYEKLIQLKKYQIKIFNSYGLTEVSIDTALSELSDHNTQYYPVGLPIGDQELFILSNQGKIAPKGIFGQLAIRGKCVGLPLLLDPEKYIFQEDNQSSITYLTGDLAMIHPVFGLIIKGRQTDDFIKVHGKRIPVKEIERFILLNTIALNCFVFEKDGKAVLLHESDLEDEKLYSLLQSNFANYQLPDMIVKHTDWPVNNNGKTDKLKIKSEFIFPKSSLNSWEPGNSNKEKIVFELFQKMDKPICGINDSLIYNGWNSIDLLSFCNELTLKGFNLSPNLLMRNPNISTIINFISENKNEENEVNLNPDSIDLDDVLKILNNE